MFRVTGCRTDDEAITLDGHRAAVGGPEVHAALVGDEAVEAVLEDEEADE